ncbi:unnamed protein product [Cylindrotheca closterium]|uniref:SAYSvFN domain-containing protein n=1 Tax=Cylindrotheca closterium TaxID=2856 RepID=A0AAD2GBE3_9STRA|nr:unnamed protein product [Cylindrotheca closterium]
MVRSANEKSSATYVASAVWTLCVGLLIWSDLGVLAFFGSILFLIWVFGLREKFSNEETASAYSVFNLNQQAIAGTLTAGQVDRQLRGGGIANNTNGSIGNNSNIAMAASQNNNSQTAATNNVSQEERLRRRKAAAMAAERRFQQPEQ